MKNNVIKFPGQTSKLLLNQKAKIEKKAFLAGFAAGICDSYQQGSAVEALQQSGITYEAFVEAEVDEYDLEILEEIFI